MNREHTLFHLREAMSELENTISELASDPNFSEAEFYVSAEHIYHHLNTAWNAREASKSEATECSEPNFNKWRCFPSEFSLGSQNSVDNKA